MNKLRFVNKKLQDANNQNKAMKNVAINCAANGAG